MGCAEISTIKLLYMGANRYGRIWKKEVADEPSFYGQNFNYQPMLPLTSVPSSTDIETACTLVQISDTVPPYVQETSVPVAPLFAGPDVEQHNDAMDKIVDRLDVCQWHPFNGEDTMDKIVFRENKNSVQVETKNDTKNEFTVKVETKCCFIKLVTLDSILLNNCADAESEENNGVTNRSPTTPNSLHRLRPQNKKPRTTRHPRQASQNVEYNKLTISLSPIKNKPAYVKNIKPRADGPSEDRIKAQTNHSNHPTSSLPGLPIPETDPYEVDTDIESDSPTDPNNKTTSDTDTNPTKKGRISITSHVLKKKSNPRKYQCKLCERILNSAHELTSHHQTTHGIVYCSVCSKAFNNRLSLSRHEYEHHHRSLKCPNCERTFTFNSQLKAHQFAHSTKPSFFCVYPNCGKAFFFETDLTRHSKRHNNKWYQCLD